MPLTATFRHGDPQSVDYTAGANVAAGDVVLLGNTAGLTNGIAHRPIANGEKGALFVGTGIYYCKVASNYAAYTKLYVDNANAVLTSTSTNMSFFGWNTEAAGAANAVVECMHWPRLTA
jgi:predicted RecA/RadA family phage recombinase